MTTNYSDIIIITDSKKKDIIKLTPEYAIKLIRQIEKQQKQIDEQQKQINKQQQQINNLNNFIKQTKDSILSNHSSYRAQRNMEERDRIARENSNKGMFFACNSTPNSTPTSSSLFTPISTPNSTPKSIPNPIPNPPLNSIPGLSLMSSPHSNLPHDMYDIKNAYF